MPSVKSNNATSGDDFLARSRRLDASSTAATRRKFSADATRSRNKRRMIGFVLATRTVVFSISCYKGGNKRSSATTGASVACKRSMCVTGNDSLDTAGSNWRVYASSTCNT